MKKKKYILLVVIFLVGLQYGIDSIFDEERSVERRRRSTIKEQLAFIRAGLVEVELGQLDTEELVISQFAKRGIEMKLSTVGEYEIHSTRGGPFLVRPGMRPLTYRMIIDISEGRQAGNLILTHSYLQ